MFVVLAGSESAGRTLRTLRSPLTRTGKSAGDGWHAALSPVGAFPALLRCASKFVTEIGGLIVHDGLPVRDWHLFFGIPVGMLRLDPEPFKPKAGTALT